MSYAGPFPAIEERLDEALRRLRLARGMSVAATALESGVARTSLLDWESGRRMPWGAGLVRLLDALEAEPRLRARMLALADPKHARIALAGTAMGAPVDVGAVLRAMRRRRGMTQAEGARAAGVSQGTVAKWESGDQAPSTERLHALGFALGATPEEISALTTVRNNPGRPTADLGSLENEAINVVQRSPAGLQEIGLLTLEHEFWWRAAREPRALGILASVVARRAHLRLFSGDQREIEPLARRAMRLARESGAYGAAAPAVYASAWMRGKQGLDAAGAARLLGGWESRVVEKPIRDWLTSAKALAWARAGEADRGVEALRSLDRSCVEENGASSAMYREDLVDAFLLSGRPRDAMAAFEALEGPAPARLIVRLCIAQGVEPPAEALKTVREEARGAWYKSIEFDEIERSSRKGKNRGTPV